MKAVAQAQPNIALIKYWGKRDIARNLPAVGSISIALSDLYTSIAVQLDDALDEDSLSINGVAKPQSLPRMSACLDNILGNERTHARIVSECNFPMAAGLASSASAFAAATLAAAAAGGRTLSTTELSRLAGRASGSAARSLYGGFAELRNDEDNISIEQLCDKDAWPLRVVVAITESGPKHTGSTDAMELSRQTSPFYSSWVAQQDDDLAVARVAIEQRDFSALAAIAEHNCLKMHSVMWASRPAITYWNSATMRCMETIRALQNEGRGVFFTIDAGPQIKAVCLPEDEETVADALAATTGVQSTMRCGLGDAARVME